MYGSISRIRIKSGQEGAVEALVRTWVHDRGPTVDGFIADYLLTPDGTSGERFALTIFDSAASYRKNAVDPAQHAWYEQFRALLEADPEWHDGAVTELIRATVPL